MHVLGIAAIGVLVGFLSGLFGKGGSAVATPLLHALGVPAVVALAAPLPATIPSTLVAGAAYWPARLIDRRVLAWSVGAGAPATIAGALATVWIRGTWLVTATDGLVALLGLRFLLGPRDQERPAPVPPSRLRLCLVAVAVGLVSGLLANSGGFLLAPLYVAVLRLPIKPALATSLAASALLAVPGTVIHGVLGHIDWWIVLEYAVTSVPLAYVGARVGLAMNAGRLERIYGGALTVAGLGFLAAAAWP